MKTFHLPLIATVLGLAVALTLPVLANDPVQLKMTLSGAALDVTAPDPPTFQVITNARGHVVIDHIDLVAGTADIIGLHVGFDLQLCADALCTQVIKTVHYFAQFGNTTGTASGDPGNPNEQFVSANPTTGRLHGNDGTVTTQLDFAQFDYSNLPTLGYDVNFAFRVPEFNNDDIQVMLHGPI